MIYFETPNPGVHVDSWFIEQSLFKKLKELCDNKVSYMLDVHKYFKDNETYLYKFGDEYYCEPERIILTKDPKAIALYDSIVKFNEYVSIERSDNLKQKN